MTAPPRSLEQRTQDALARLDNDVDAWFATAEEAGGIPYLVPLSFLWHGDSLVIATPTASPTGRNLLATGRARVGVGPTRDVLLIEATVEPLAEIPDDLGAAFATKTGFDPRELSTPYTYFRLRPQRIQAWREVNELAGREILRDGRWVLSYFDLKKSPRGGPPGGG